LTLFPPRHYIAQARRRRPIVPRHVSEHIVNQYVNLRKLSKSDEQENKQHSYTSARTLLGVLRLSQALARLRWAEEVEEADVEEALRLMSVSKESLYDEENEGHEGDRSAVSQIYRIIKDMASGGGRRPKRRRRLGRGPGRERDMDVDDDNEDGDGETLTMVDIRARVLGAGFTEVQFMQTIQEAGFLLALAIPHANIFCSTKIWASGSAPGTTRGCSSLPERYTILQPAPRLGPDPCLCVCCLTIPSARLVLLLLCSCSVMMYVIGNKYICSDRYGSIRKEGISPRSLNWYT
jgi:hypothetical protein